MKFRACFKASWCQMENNIYSSSMSDQITPPLYQLHWLKARSGLSSSWPFLRTGASTERHDVSGRWTHPAGGPRDQNPPPTIGTDHIIACVTDPSYTAVDCRRPSLSCSRCNPLLKRPASPRHVRIISACFPKPSEDALLPSFFLCNFYSVSAKWLLSLLKLKSLIFTYLLFLLPYVIATLRIRHSHWRHKVGHAQNI